MTDFEGLLEALSGAGVEFILVGGVAATVHGSARLTQDIDVVYARAGENLERLVAALAAHGPYLRGAPSGRSNSATRNGTHGYATSGPAALALSLWRS